MKPNPMLDRIAGLESAEDFFELLGLPYDAHVLARSRLPILRRFAAELEDLMARGSAATEAEWRAQCRLALERAYRAFADPPPGAQLTAAARLVKLRAPGRYRQ